MKVLRSPDAAERPVRARQRGAGHFLQEGRAEGLTKIVADFIQAN
jgi:hypothetical protein